MYVYIYICVGGVHMRVSMYSLKKQVLYIVTPNETGTVLVRGILSNCPGISRLTKKCRFVELEFQPLIKIPPRN